MSNSHATLPGGISCNDIYVMPVAGHQLLFAPSINIAALVSTSGIQALHRWLCDGGPAPRNIAPLTEALTAPDSPAASASLPSPLGLILTRGCDMACRYCDFGGNELQDGVMSRDLLLAVIDGWVTHVKGHGGQRLELHFFGGEPFTRPDLVKLAVEHTRRLAAREGLHPHFDASTNGLFSRGGLEFAREHFDSLNISLDGIGEEHDRHRPLAGGRPSFHLIHDNLMQLREGNVRLGLRCCVSSANETRMAEIAARFARDYNPALIDFETMQTPFHCAEIGVKVPSRIGFARGFIHARRAAAALGVACTVSTLFDPTRKGFCPVDRGAFIVGPTGSVRSCYLPAERWQARGMNLEIGRASTSAGLKIDDSARARVASYSARRPACERCLCLAGCNGGCLLQSVEKEDPTGRTGFCRQTRLIQTCVLLDNLGREDLTDRLLSDGPDQEALLASPSDLLGDRPGTRP